MLLSPSASGVEPLPSELNGPAAAGAGDNPLARIFQTSQDIITISGADLQLTYVSPSTRDVLGWEPEVLAERYAELVHPDDIGSTIEFATRLARATDARRSVPRAACSDADGSWRRVEAWAVNLLDDPDYRGCYTVIRDITDRPTEALAKSPHDLRFQAAVNMASPTPSWWSTPRVASSTSPRPPATCSGPGRSRSSAAWRPTWRCRRTSTGSASGSSASLRDDGKSEAIRFQLSLDTDIPSAGSRPACSTSSTTTCGRSW